MSEVPVVLERLRAAGDRVPSLPSPYPLKAPSFGAPSCAAELDELQKILGSPLPYDYAQYLATCRRIDAMDVFNGYSLFSVVDVCRQLGAGAAPRTLHVALDGPIAEVRVFTVGGDGGGNLFVMGYRGDGVGHVWKWMHGSDVRFDGVAASGITLLATSFCGFLERMAEDWEQFVNGNRAWQYFAG